MEKAHRITYRFDRYGNKIDEGMESNRTQENDNRPSYELELEQLEQLIRNADSHEHGEDKAQTVQVEEAVQVERAPQMDEVLQVNEMVHMERTPQMHEVLLTDRKLLGAEQQVPNSEVNERHTFPARSSSSSSFTWMQGTISVASAIISGGLIGYLLLTLIFGITAWPISALAKPEQHNSVVADPSAVDEASRNNQDDIEQGGAENMGTVPITDSQSSSDTGLQLNKQVFQYYVLQAGVFAQENTRDEVISSLQQAGFPAHFTSYSDNRYYVYAGVATTTADADTMKAGIKGIETYRKPLMVALPNAMTFDGEPVQLERYFQQSNDLIAMYAELVAAQLEQSSYSPIGEAARAAWKANYEDWSTMAEETAKLWTTQADIERASQLQDHLTEAQQQLEQYQSKPKSAYLWSVQAALVKSVLIQKDWFESVNTLS